MNKIVMFCCLKKLIYNITIALNIVLITCFVLMKTRSDDIAHKYMDTAPKIGRLYALECQNIDSVRLLLDEKRKCSSPRTVLDYLSLYAFSERQYNQEVFDAFEKKVVQLKAYP